MQSIANPFSLSQPNFRQFTPANWEAMANQLSRCCVIDSMRPLLVVGQPHVGKTSLITSVSSGWRNSRMIWIKLARWQSPRLSLYRILHLICNETIQQLGTADTSPSEVMIEQSQGSAFVHFFAKLCAKRNDECIILIFDRFDLVEHVLPINQSYSTLLNFLLSLVLSQRNFGLIFESRSPGNSERLLKSCGFGVPERIICQLYSENDISRFLSSSLRETGLKFSDAAQQQILALTGGHPHLTELIAYYVINEFNVQRIGGNPNPLLMPQEVGEILKKHAFCCRIEQYAKQVANAIRYNRNVGVKAILQYLDNSGSSAAEDVLAAALCGPNRPIEDQVQLREMLSEFDEYGLLQCKEEYGRHIWAIRSQLFRGQLLSI